MSTHLPVDTDLLTILAKSDPPESLIEHTWHVLSRLADQRCLRPALATESGQPRLWHWLFWGTFLHDFGKAASGFQAMMVKKATTWGHRHEVLSLAFVDWLFPDHHPDRPYVIAVIACHHRDADLIVNHYRPDDDDPESDSAAKLRSQLSDGNIRRLYRFLVDHSHEWAKRLGFAPHIEFPPLPPLETAVTQITASAIHRAVSELNAFVEPLVFRQDAAGAVMGALLRGHILIADHAGSAHSEPFLAASIDAEAIISRLGAKSLFRHQIAAADAPPGSMLLISPTSSGKTESALLWLAQQQTHDGRAAPRLFYLLPYQASMNAMYMRLKTFFDEKHVGLEHSRMAQVLFAMAQTQTVDAQTATTYARQQKALAHLLSFPVTVASPYQLLKIPYQLKGFEALVTNLYGGRFVLDEIHAYEPRRLALIIAMMRFLHQHAQARFFIMTATLPPHVRDLLQTALTDLTVVEADAPTFKQFERHRVHLLPGDLLSRDVMAHIVRDAAAQSVLICCNTVRRAFEVSRHVADALNTTYPDETFEIILLHSRFNGDDRHRKETQIMARTGVNSGQRARTIVIATQVVEVSLNIDLDTIYTEAAPLEALVQRFGRVNRGRPAGTPPANVYVVREQPDTVKYVYGLNLIGAALACLESADGTVIDESHITRWLSHIYTGDILAAWQDDYNTSVAQFQQEVMDSLRPFRASDLDRQFYQMFDSVDVLPMSSLSHYEQLLRKGQYFEAAGLLVSVPWRVYKPLEKRRQAWHETKNGKDVHIINVPYSPENGLDLYAAYNPQGTANDRPGSPLDDYDVPPEAD